VGPGCQLLEREGGGEAGGACWAGSNLGLGGKRIGGRGEGGPDEKVGPDEMTRQVGKETDRVVDLGRGKKRKG
jgi:hypothetical protein